MMNQLIATILLFTAPALVESQDNFYTIDPSHSIVSFKASHVGFGSVIGSFSSYEGNIYFEDEKNISTSISLYIESLSTNNQGRDGILKEQFFQKEKYPVIQFSSTSIQLGKEGRSMIGDLTIGAITKRVEIPFEIISTPIRDQFGHDRIALKGGLTINRKEYDIFYRGNSFWDSIVADEIEISLEVSAYQYNSLKTIFPFQENEIGRMLFEAFNSNGINGAKEVFSNQFDDASINTSHFSNLRGACHIAQSGDLTGAISILELSLTERDDLDITMRAEYIAQKARYHYLNKSLEIASNETKKALRLDPNNTLAAELKKQLLKTIENE